MELLIACADPESFGSIHDVSATGVNSNNVFVRSERIQIALKAGHHRSASGTQFKGPNNQFECWLGSFVIVQCIRTSIAKKPYSVMIIQGAGVQTSCHFSGSAHAIQQSLQICILCILTYIYILMSHCFYLERCCRCRS